MTTKMILALALAVTLAVVAPAGCSNDAVAPHDELPPVQPEGAATQAAIVAVAIAQIGPLALTFPGKAAGDYTYEFPAGTGIHGYTLLSFRCGGSGGDGCAPAQADYCWLLTPPSAPLMLETPSGATLLSFGFDISAEIDHGSGLAILSSNHAGVFNAGDYAATWELDGVVVRIDGYPSDGRLIFHSGSHTATVSFDGNQMARLAIGDRVWTVNLDEGTLTEVT